MARLSFVRTQRWLAGAGLASLLWSGCASPKVAQPDPANPFGAPPSAVATGPVKSAEPPEPPLVEEPVSTPTSRARLQLAYGQLQEQRGEAAAARISYQRALQEDSKMVEAHVGIARLDVAGGRMADAERRLREAIRAQPTSAFALAALGQFFGDQSQWPEALDYYTQAMNAAPDDKRYAFQLAIAMAKSGRIEESRPLFARSVGEAAGHHNIAIILRQQGDIAGATREAELALTKDPSQQQTRELLAQLRGRDSQTVRSEEGPRIRPGRSTQHHDNRVLPASATIPLETDSRATDLGMTPGHSMTARWPESDSVPPAEGWQRMPTSPGRTVH